MVETKLGSEHQSQRKFIKGLTEFQPILTFVLQCITISLLIYTVVKGPLKHILLLYVCVYMVSVLVTIIENPLIFGVLGYKKYYKIILLKIFENLLNNVNNVKNLQV